MARSDRRTSRAEGDPRRYGVSRADILVALARAGSHGDREGFAKFLAQLVAQERAKGHHALADRLAAATIPAGTFARPTTALGQADSQALRRRVPERRLSSLILPRDVEVEIGALVAEHAGRKTLEAQGLEPRRALLLTGPPGNGKTSLAEALAAELELPLVTLRHDRVVKSHLGETGAEIAKAFEAVASERCVFFVDELDALGSERGRDNEVGEMRRVVIGLLLELDRLPSHVVVVAATNHPELLDSAAGRRFEARLELAAPGADQIARYLGCVPAPVGAALLARRHRLEGMSFAALEGLALDVRRWHALGRSDLDHVVEGRIDHWRRAVKKER